ncbi:hypothetical protein HanPSC8_Chr10g0409941 [Helianthus annuus]|nr:hypothetical protein HanPSC8_Chr10g0409941 [Helianthus annuus]
MLYILFKPSLPNNFNPSNETTKPLAPDCSAYDISLNNLSSFIESTDTNTGILI